MTGFVGCSYQVETTGISIVFTLLSNTQPADTTLIDYRIKKTGHEKIEEVTDER